jgi:site-specific DNA-cytosine methylase
MSKAYSWIPHIPLIGGLPLGAEAALGTAPKFVSSLDGFWANDSHYMNHQVETLQRQVEYRTIDADERSFIEKVDIVVSTPPCAGLSQLNTGKANSSAKGADAEKNQFMYIAAEQAMKCYDAEVIIGENAPALYTNKGKPVADKLLAIARANGYSFTLYKTTTSLHGIPQNRDRTFYIFWKGDKAPIMNWFNEPRKNFAEYLKEVPKDALHQDIIINPRIGNESYYNFIQHLNPGKNPRDIILGANCNTAFNYVQRGGFLNEALAHFGEIKDEKGERLATHAKMKFDKGLGIWDGSTHVFNECMNAVIGRNMADTIHPTENRSLTIREAMHLMGFPHDFYLKGGRSSTGFIAQNVPVCTARSIANEAVKFLNGKLEQSNTDFVKQNNHKQIIEVGSPDYNTLEQFIA